MKKDFRPELPIDDRASAPAFDKRSLAEPQEVALLLCPECGDRGVPAITNRPYKFCLRCGWTNQEKPA
jgi:hypothetical protein